MLVDDEPAFLSLVARWLERDYDLKLFTSGEGVYEALGELKPDLVVLDANMQPVDGYELCRRIRGDARFDLTSVLFLTGAKSDADLVRQIEAGGSGFLNKPIEPEELRRVIAEELAA
ncbi:MAG: hypothetical protein A2V88_10070 [Elusimicrobia bacterium RBG_16_66_12]|nr:MAG: hypothetical protein A2V88_10070 [Elusimicrobia bacterium RBG_16_66_12]